MARGKKNKEPSLPFGIDETFVAELNAMSTDAIKALLARIEIQKDETEEFKKNPAFIEAKDALALVKGPYNDTKKALKNKTKMAIERLKDKGGA